MTGPERQALSAAGFLFSENGRWEARKANMNSLNAQPRATDPTDRRAVRLLLRAFELLGVFDEDTTPARESQANESEQTNGKHVVNEGRAQ